MEIDYRRWQEFIHTTHADNSFDGLSPKQRRGKQKDLREAYVEWLKQQKPVHLDFEVK
jgi:hypothetical protein